MKRVYFDECGNTGQNLFDDADAIFVLASCSFDPSQEQQALTHLQSFKGPELKFSRLRRTSAGQRAVLTFLNSTCVTSATTTAVLFHKPHMVVTKYCDLVLEPSMRKSGVDFYERGLNISTANLLTTTMPVFLNPKSWSAFLSLFVRVVRERTSSLFLEWQTSAEIIYSHLASAQPQMADFIAPIMVMRNPDVFFATLSDDELDPLVPAYHFMAGHWSQQIDSRYELIVDASKVIAKQKYHLMKLSDLSLNPVTVGYDHRKMEYPLKVADIIAVDSKSHRQVQFADILAGALAGAAKARTKAPLQDGTFAHDVLTVFLEKGLIINWLWPSDNIDPKGLGIDDAPVQGDVDVATYTAMILQGHPATKKGSE